MAIRGILFDKDGTLLDFEATWQPVMREAARVAAGQDEALANHLLEIGGYDAQAERVLPGSILSAGNTGEICRLWAEHLPGRQGESLIPVIDRVFEEGGARHSVSVTELAPLFRRLKGQGLRLGVATNDSVGGARASLRRFEILELLDFLAGYDSGYGAKPGPGMVLAFCEQLELDPGSVAVVGDNTHDLEMGRRAGVGLKIGVLTGGSAPTDLAPLADYVVGSINDLEGILDNQGGK